MEVIAYANTIGYRFKDILKFIKDRGAITYKDSAFVPIKDGGVCLFDYGVTVFWGLEQGDIKVFLGEMEEFEKDRLDNRYEDIFTFGFGDSFAIHHDHISLLSNDPKEKLAVSYAIAQSLKLEHFETIVAVTIDRTKKIPASLAKEGKISLDRKAIAKERGRLFISKSDINLHYHPLETPDFFWEFPEYEIVYKATADYLDIKSRIDLLNKKLMVIQELFEMLADELNHKHSSFLEWIIIILIAVEIFFFLFHDLFGLF